MKITKIATKTGYWLLLSMVWVSTIMAAKFIWVSTDSAKLKKEKSASAPVIATLPSGEKLSVIQYKRKWYQVKTKNGHIGWIYRGKVSDAPPEIVEEDDGVSDSFLDEFADSKIEADESTTARSARGLSSASKAYAKKNNSPQKAQDALDRITARKVTPKERDQFLRLGRVGEYAE